MNVNIHFYYCFMKTWLFILIRVLSYTLISSFKKSDRIERKASVKKQSIPGWNRYILEYNSQENIRIDVLLRYYVYNREHVFTFCSASLKISTFRAFLYELFLMWIITILKPRCHGSNGGRKMPDIIRKSKHQRSYFVSSVRVACISICKRQL